MLSGFPISGLLYSEYKKRQDISITMFFVRRGLKIYPAFYVLIVITFVAQHLLWQRAIFGVVAVGCLTLRCLTIWVFPPVENLTAHVANPTPRRIDASFLPPAKA